MNPQNARKFRLTTPKSILAFDLDTIHSSILGKFVYFTNLGVNVKVFVDNFFFHVVLAEFQFEGVLPIGCQTVQLGQPHPEVFPSTYPISHLLPSGIYKRIVTNK